jgi:hypothetical protein
MTKEKVRIHISEKQEERESSNYVVEKQIFPNPWQDPEKREKIIQGQKDAWSDPVKRQARLAKTQSTEAKQNRSKGIQQRYKEDAAYRKAQKDSGRRRGEQHMKEALGENPKEKMQAILQSKKTVGEIATELDISYSTARIWIKKLRIKKRRS